MAVVFGQTLQHGFVNLDDPEYVYENQHVFNGLDGAEIGWAFRSFHAANWHPLTWLSHMLDCEFYGASASSAGGHHASSVLLHAAAAMILFLLLRRMTGSHLAQRLGGGRVRRPSPAGRIRRLGGRTQGRPQRAVFRADPLGLRRLRRPAVLVAPLRAGGRCCTPWA